ncbi:MAG: hypothetical protein RJA99_1770 [Pseudomonadota bacterium]|jgi:hypothetical protein
MTRTFDRANAHALAAIVEASGSHDIAACEDIVDDRGTMLWARGKPVRPELMERLLERTLRRPIEQCLSARDGVASQEVAQCVERLLDGSGYLSALAGGDGRRIVATARTLPLEGPVALLLTAAQSRGEGFVHACLGLLLAGALAARGGVADGALQRIALAGLLHDLGELYVNPDYIKSRRELSLDEWRHVAVHPRIGELFLREQTRYPAAIAAIVGAHHERLDGSGYPARSTVAKLPDEAGWVIAAETMAGVLADPVAAPARAVLAMGLVFGEYPMTPVGIVSSVQRGFAVEVDSSFDREAARAGVAAVRESLRTANATARELEERAPGERERRTLARLAPLLRRLDLAFVSSGTAHFFELLGASAETDDAEIVLQLRLVPREIRWRMRSLARDIAQDLGGFTERGRDAFEPLLTVLRGEPPPAGATAPRSAPDA